MRRLRGLWWMVLGLLLFVGGCNQPVEVVEEAAVPEFDSSIYYTRYGFYAEGLLLDTLSVPGGSALSKILVEAGADPALMVELDSVLRGKLSPRSIRAGNAVYTWSNPADTSLMYWVYQHTLTQYLLLDFTGTHLSATVAELPVETRRCYLDATIYTSLWNAMDSARALPQLALDISDILSWSVDFFAVDKGDRFRAFYDALYLDGQPIGVGTIHALQYIDRKDTVQAYRYTADSTPSYWDAKGNSVRKAFLKAPLRFSRISSRFSYARHHPVLRIVRPHTGVDYAAPSGTPVVALGDGTVVQRGYSGGGGNTVKIRHNSVYTTGYMHLSRYGKGIRVGGRVQQGQVIGYVGSTGLSTGPHLDFRVWRNGSPINPLSLQSPSVKPLDTAQMPGYLIRKRELDSLFAAYQGKPSGTSFNHPL